MSDEKTELGKIDPKCWLCGAVVRPIKIIYQPLICEDCKPEYKKRKFVFVRASAAEIEELFPIVERKQ